MHYTTSRSFLNTLALVVLAAIANGLSSEKSSGGRGLKQKDIVNRYKTVYQDTTTQLRNAILDGDVDLATSILIVNNDPEELGAGLRFPPGDASQYDIVTPERVSDPDVVTIKAVAGASLRLADCERDTLYVKNTVENNPQIMGILKLAKALIIAMTPESGVFPKDVNEFMLQVEVISMLADRVLMQQILDDDVLESQLNRKLLIAAGIPVRSWFCRRCYPNRLCRRVTWWC